MHVDEAARLFRLGQLADAEAQARSIIDVDPTVAEVHALLGRIHYARGFPARAAEAFRNAIRLSPNAIEPRVNLAAALGQLGDFSECLEAIDAALTMQPSHPLLHRNRGVALERMGRPLQAAIAYRKAIEIQPGCPESFLGLGNALRMAGRVSEAAECYHEAIRQRPNYAMAFSGLAAIHAEMGDASQAILYYRRAIRTEPASAAKLGHAILYTLHYQPEHTADYLFKEHVRWAGEHTNVANEKGQFPNVRDVKRRLRVGYISPDFRDHTVARFVLPLLLYHSPQQVETFCYSDVQLPDLTTGEIQAVVDHWYETRRLSDVQLRQLVRDHLIDILVDLRGHGADNRLQVFACRSAPIQVTLIGYFNTTGLTAMDYRITDAWQDPAGVTDRHHTERLIRLPGSCWCYMPRKGSELVSELPARKNGYVTFGSLNKYIKVSEPCIATWALAMRAVHESQLRIAVDLSVQQAILDRFKQYGISPDRLTIMGKTREVEEYLQRFNEIDIALDTYPFNGITTTCDALWMGVPTVSLSGQTSVSRAGASILYAAGLAQLATDCPENFRDVVVRLSADIGALAELRYTMRNNLLKSALMDHRTYARRVEGAYRRMWESWCGSIGPCRHNTSK